MKNNIKILVGIPCFNCESQLPRMLKKIKKSTLKIIYEIIIIDNRSTDNTVKNAIKFKKYFQNFNVKFKVFINKSNYSLGGSHKVIFNYSLKNNFSHTLILHGDDQANIFNFNKVLQSSKYLEFDCVLGSRFMSDSRLKGYSAYRIFGNHLFNLLFSLRLLAKIHDIGSGLNLYNNRLLEIVDYKSCPDDLTFNCQFLILTYKANLNVIFYPIDWTELDQISNAKLLSQSIKILGQIFGINTSIIHKNYESTDITLT